MRVGIGRAARGNRSLPGGVAARAVARALLGAAGLDDAAGDGPSPVDGPDGADRSSLELLSRAVRSVEGENYQVVNVDVTVAGDGARTASVDVAERLADRLHVAPEKVSVKPDPASGGTAEGEGGPAAVAVALLDRVSPMDQVHSALRGGG